MKTFATKDNQINDILNKLIDPGQFKDLEERIASVKHDTQKATQTAYKRTGQKAPDVASILRALEQRAATKAPRHPTPSYAPLPTETNP
ncbi:hypothetical protein QBC32DRAFT_319576 [Pseudoneurospora amorphoporcata]|uniref:Uncharacterized protein n=1 Tax=Pseudoneurospora amorphoporcata TaxID=241081 RepID=A0AAN6NKK5_9PEZI|nr:hypothetical protein QBC32DRAFT_319576 [Pseudoneurospora amorphoporcata]